MLNVGLSLSLPRAEQEDMRLLKSQKEELQLDISTN